MLFANPVPAEFASGQYYDNEGAAYYLSPAKLESDYAIVRFQRELKIFRQHCQTGAVLDVGCSSGAFLYQLIQRFPGAYEILGTDVSGAPLDYAESKGVPVLRGDFLTHDFGVKKFDAVTFWAVLEHLLEPKRFLQKAASILEPGGKCFVLVPNMKSLAVRSIGKRYRYIYPQHLNYFTAATLKELAKKFFEPEEIHFTHFNPIVIWQDWRRGGVEVSNRERGLLLKRTTAYKQSPLMKPAKAFYRLSEHGLAAFGLTDNVAAVFKKPNGRSR
ncbi:MAG TPA: class I SAM-dependent methyltransferase [Verrucomicrobiae bacterium]|jgi:2-polyprenyl-3-methyl-5-hydroxy-6-metoxy-1,4-benzoquinol methylase